MPLRFYCVDLLRGLSSIVILLWHYNHFWHPLFGVKFTFDRTIQPLYFVFWPAYHYGLFAVQFFWLISGLVFAHVYAGSSITAGEFALRRFARLYPLHAVTLIVVTVLQAISVASTGHTQIIGNFDLYHFIANVLFFTPNWGRAYSFNSPIWSVTIEEVIYAIFFVLCSVIFVRRAVLPLLLCFACLLVTMTSPKLMLFSLCGFYFFAGTLLYQVAMTLRERPISGLVAMLFFAAGTALILRVPDSVGDPKFFIKPVVVFLPLMAAAVLIDLRGWAKPFFEKTKWLGDCTYSMYLWHFPVQIAVLIVLTYFGVSRDVFTSPILLLAWIASMIAIGRLSFVYLERPAQLALLRVGRPYVRQDSERGGNSVAAASGETGSTQRDAASEPLPAVAYRRPDRPADIA
jgi:peptidoglycan/LPS O-acetylase OafA/YrhL